MSRGISKCNSLPSNILQIVLQAQLVAFGDYGVRVWESHQGLAIVLCMSIPENPSIVQYTPLYILSSPRWNEGGMARAVSASNQTLGVAFTADKRSLLHENQGLRNVTLKFSEKECPC